ncbi:MAG: hypothetical protein M3Z66_08725, partial [Chloroflexota bacterium]|nr:hypothetical protein [Chloroflexota bacterium]
MTGAIRRLGVVVAIAFFWLTPSTSSQTSVAASAAPPTFGVPVVSGVQGYGFEQDLRLDTKGTVYTSSPDSLSSTTSFVWRSFDRGQTFKLVPAATQPNGKLLSCPGGGDTELATDSANNLYFNDLTLANFSTFRSSDQGRTLAPQSCASVVNGAVDRQWYAVDGDPTNGGSIFLAYDRIAQANPAVCPSGTTGNNELVIDRSPITAAAAATAGTQFGPSQVVSCDEGIMGNDEFHNYPDHGKRIFVIHDNAAFNSISMGRCDVVDATVSPTGLRNCVDVLISSFPNGRTGGSFATMTIDRAGNLYAIWEQAPFDTTTSTVTGDTALMFSKSTDEGTTWSAAAVLPTPGLRNNVFAWPGAGDSGKLDVAWYGTPAPCDAACQKSDTGCGTGNTCIYGGPDQIKGDWSVWFEQSLDGGQTWSQPIQASEHFIHRGNIQTVLGGQEGDRTLGDFIQLRVGLDGEANISYGDSNNIDEAVIPQATFVRQNGGSSVFDAAPVVNGAPALINSVTDPAGDATFDSAGVSSSNLPNLDILGSSISMPDATHYKITMKLADLTSLTPSPQAGGTDLVWLTQWHVPSGSDPHGGKLFFAYMESTAGGTPQCYDGENALYFNAGGAGITYPGKTALPASACQYTPTAPGTITITVPLSDVAEANPISNILYSVNASTQTLSAPANSSPSLSGIGGVPPNLVDVAPTYDFNPSASPTVAQVERFSAHRSGTRLHFSWTMKASGATLGFLVYAGSHRLNRSLIPVHRSPTYRYS